MENFIGNEFLNLDQVAERDRTSLYLYQMDDNKRAELKEIIEKRIVKTIKQIEGYESMAQPITPENSIGRISRMDAINNKSVVDAALRTSREKLSGLKTMLNKIHDDDFGQCERCGAAIPEQRMILMPQSMFCVRCAR